MARRRIAVLVIASLTAAGLPFLARAQEPDVASCVPDAARRSMETCASLGAPRAETVRAAPPTAVSHFAAPRRIEADPAATTTGPGVEIDVRSNLLSHNLEVRALDLLQQEIETTERIVLRMPDGDPRGADYLLRLAETFFELETYWTTAARSLDQPLFEARRDGETDRAVALEHEQHDAEQHLTEARARAIRTYARLVDGYPTYSRMDEVLFSLASGLEELGQFDRARQVFLRLIRGFPSSQLLPHAWLSFAEHYFGESDMASARQFYSKVLEYPYESPNPVYGYALYKQAWVLYNLDDFRGALTQFVSVLEFTAANPDSRDAESMARQARRELVLPYSRVGRPAQALELFRRYAQTDDQAYEMLESLAELYYDTGQWPETIQIYHRLMSERSSSDRTCYWQSRVANAVVSSRPKPEQVVEIQRLVDLVGVFDAESHPEEARTECRQAAATVLVELATAWHREAMGTDEQPGTNDRTTMELAGQLYRMLVDRFPDMEAMQFPEIDRRDWPTLYRVSYFYAELLWRMESWQQCGPAFDRVVDLDPNGELTPDAAYAAVLCYNSLYQQQYAAVERDRASTTRASPRAARRGSRRRGAPEPESEPTLPPAARDFTPAETAMIQAFQRFRCYVSASDELPTIEYRLARIFYEAGHYEEAAALFRGVAFERSAHELGEFAANLYLDSLESLRLRDRRGSCAGEIAEDVEPLAALYCAEPVAQDAHAVLCPILGELRCGLLRLTAEGLQSERRHRDAAAAYVAIARDHPECGRRDEMLWNAAINYESARLLGRAIQVRQALIRGFPESDLARRAIYLVGANYHALAIYSSAADWYERFAREHPDSDAGSCTPEQATQGTCAVAYVALENAVFFRLGLGEEDAAIEDASLYERSYRRSRARESSQVIFSLGSIYERRSDWPRVLSHYQAFLHDYGRTALPHEIIRANVQMGRAETEMGRPDRAEPYFSVAVRAWERGAPEAIASVSASEAERALWLARAQEATSEALFQLADRRYEQFRAVRFPRYTGARTHADVRRWSAEALGPWLQRKFEALHEAEAAYDLIAPLHIPEWQIASAARVGEMYRSIVDDVRSAPVPAEIENDDELYAIYTDALERVLNGSSPGPDGQWETEDDILCTERSREDTCVRAPVRQATERFQFCLTLSTRVRWFDAFSAQCESELNAIDRSRYPLAAELRGTGSFVQDQIAEPGAVELDREEADEAFTDDTPPPEMEPERRPR